MKKFPVGNFSGYQIPHYPKHLKISSHLKHHDASTNKSSFSISASLGSLIEP